MEHKHWTKPIQNKEPYPWLNWIEQLTKTYEGRLFWKDWIKMNVGDTITFYCEDKELNVKITELLRFENFAKAFEAVGTKLVPINNITPEFVQSLYEEIFKMTKEQIENRGVVLVGLELI